jgi:hypothetical protein
VIVRPRHLASLLCALPLLASCGSASTGTPFYDDDVASDKGTADVAPPDAAPDVATPDAAPDVTPDATSIDAPDVAPLDVAPDLAPVDVAPDLAPVDVAPDTSCRTRCSGFCSDPDVDVHNCGLCGNDCTLRAGVDGARVRCEAGRCVFAGACLPGRANCTGNPDDGCEALVTTAARCGACATACRDPAPNCGMVAGSPTGYACTSGCVDPTPMRCGSACVNTMTDALNCGACGTVCPAGLRGSPACSMGRCTLTCIAGYGDCDGNAANGCETLTSSNVANCGACGTVCPPGPGGAPVCTAGACTITCTAGSGNCDGNAANGCETDVRTSAANCGACGNACPARANAASSCAASVCAVTCNAGFGNCNASVLDGCEANFASDPLNCGACARRCATAANAAAACMAGACGIACLAGFGNCDGNGLNGCETPLSTDPRNCGACGTACPGGPGATAACAAGRCGLTCTAGAGDCNAAAADGCEVDLTTSNTHCGACGSACTAPADATAQCAASRCVITCNDGFILSGATCVRTGPRPVAPAAGSIVTNRTPVFRVALPAGQTGARVEVCGDRACTSVATTFTLTGASGSPTLALAPGTYYWRATGLIAGAPATPAGVVVEFTVNAGAGVTTSSSWGPFFDPANDRFADLLVGVPLSFAAFHYTNSAGTFSTLSYTTRSGSTSFAAAVAAAGDVNADGFGDALFGSPTLNTVSVFHSTGAALAASVTATLVGPTGSLRFGAAVSSAGDINGDGYADVIVGAPGSSRAFVYRGGANGIDASTLLALTPTGGSANFGVSVAGLGDVNADGFADVAVGTDGSNIVYLWYGAASGLGATPTGLSAPAGALGFGRVAGAGDVNGDGYPDVVVGAYTTGAAYLFLGGPMGPSTMPNATFTAPGTQFGAALDGVGDVNGDGFGDVVVGAPGSDTAYLFYGRAGGISPTVSVTLARSYVGFQFGTAVTGLGDYNNDGFADFAVSSINRAVQVYRGSATGPVLTYNLTGSTSYGTSIASRAVAFTPAS